MLRINLLAVALITFFSVMPVTAEEIVIPLGDQGERDAASLPQTGMKVGQVRERWGSPEVTRGPVGQPPVRQWHYPAFIVYFENEHVIRAVMKHTP